MSDFESIKTSRVFETYVIAETDLSFEVKGLPIRSYFYEGNLYLLDGPSSLIHVYSPSGKLIATQGIKGEAPWEIGSPWYYHPSPKHGYYLHDYTMQMIKEFDKEGKLIKYAKHPYLLNNIVYLKENVFITPESVAGDMIFKIYDFQKEKFTKKISIKKVLNDEKINKEQDYLYFLFQGNFVKNASNDIAYYFTYLDKFILFKQDGSIKKVCSLINSFATPNVEYSENKGIAVVPGINAALCSGMGSDAFFTIATNTGQFTKQSKYYLDIYSSDDGNYKGSVELPLLEEHIRPWDMVCVENNSIYILYENMKMVNYKLNEK